MEGSIAHKLLKNHTCKFCYDAQQLCFDAEEPFDEREDPWLSALRSNLGGADQILGCSASVFHSQASKGSFGSSACLEVPALCWPPPRGAMSHRPDLPSLLVECMPAHGQPPWNLRVQNIRASSMRGLIPGNLPNLQELVISAKDQLDICFEDPAAFFSSLTKFYACGQSVSPDGIDVMRLLTSGILMRAWPDSRRGVSIGGRGGDQEDQLMHLLAA